MRVGVNPMKHKAVLPAYKRHRIVMAVFIPSQEGYFESALEIFRMSFASLLATVDPQHVAITVIDNASIAEVGGILDAAVANGRIDRLVRNGVNRGKPDAVIGEIRASYERFVTLVDSDVLFLPGWLGEVEKIFIAWPEAGAVSPIGQPKTAFHQNTATWLHAVLRGSLRLGKVVADEDMRQFSHSIGNESLYAAHETANQFWLCRRGSAALVGGGHFVITLRRSCYDDLSYTPRLEGTGHGMRTIDEQVDRHGMLRLSTTKAHVLHLGNTVETWMHDRLASALAGPAVPLTASGGAIDQAQPVRVRLPFWLSRLLSRPVTSISRLVQKHRAPRKLQG